MCVLTSGPPAVGAARSAPARLRLEEATRAFGDRVALDRVCLTVAPGELVAVIGRSGAGKTTLLRCVSGATALSAGRILFGGEDLARLRGRRRREHRARVGMIYQQFNLVKRLRVLDNVRIGRLRFLRGGRRWAALGGYFDATQTAVALRCLDHVGLAANVWQRTDTLSGGEQQRVAIAKVLAQEPAMILADEPVASLDLANGALIMETLRRIVDTSGLTVLATLHHVDYARRWADRLVGLRQGRVVFDGPPALLDDGVVDAIFVVGRAPALTDPARELS